LYKNSIFRLKTLCNIIFGVYLKPSFSIPIGDVELCVGLKVVSSAIEIYRPKLYKKRNIQMFLTTSGRALNKLEKNILH